MFFNNKILENIQHKHNTSNSNLNEEENQNSNVSHTVSRKKIIIIGSVSFIFVAIIVSIVFYIRFSGRDPKKIVINQTDIITDQTGDIDTTINEETNKVDIRETIIKRIPI